MNIIRTYNSQNEMLYEEHFATAEEAYAEYCDCIRLLKAKFFNIGVYRSILFIPCLVYCLE